MTEIRAKIENRMVCIPIFELLPSLSDEDRDYLVDALSCEDSIIKNVADQIIEGCTDAMSYGSKGGLSTEPYTPLDKARRRIAENASEIAEEEIADLCRLVKIKDEALAKQHMHRRQNEEYSWKVKRQAELLKKAYEIVIKSGPSELADEIYREAY